MDVDRLVTWLTWVLTGLGAVAAVLLVMIRRWAGRVIVVGTAALLLLVVFAVRHQISSISTDSPEPLCNGGIGYFGVPLTGSPALCTKYRPAT